MLGTIRHIYNNTSASGDRENRASRANNPFLHFAKYGWELRGITQKEETKVRVEKSTPTQYSTMSDNSWKNERWTPHERFITSEKQVTINRTKSVQISSKSLSTVKISRGLSSSKTERINHASVTTAEKREKKGERMGWNCSGCLNYDVSFSFEIVEI